jgi:hypothetical protein
MSAEMSLCHEGVTRGGEFQPCDKPAVAMRIDVTEDGRPYPVCAKHARRPMVPLADLIADCNGGPA